MECNPSHVVSWLQHKENVDKEGMILMQKDDLSVVTVQAKLYANILAYWEGHRSFDEKEGSLCDLHGCVVVERCVLELCEPTAELPYAFVMHFSGGCTMTLSAFSEEDRENWVKALTIAPIEVKLAELSPRPSTSVPICPATPKFLGPFVNCCQQNFSFMQSLQCNESIYESKLSMTLPRQLLIQIIRSVEEDIELFTKSLMYLPKKVQEMKMEHVLRMKDDLEFYAKAIQRIDSENSFFKKSVCKEDFGMAFCPTNIHMERFVVNDSHNSQSAYHFLTGGACSDFASGCFDGGLLKFLRDFDACFNAEDVEIIDHVKFKSKILAVQKVLKDSSTLKFGMNALKTGEKGGIQHLERFCNKMEDCKDSLSNLLAQNPRLETCVEEMKNISIPGDADKNGFADIDDYLLNPVNLQTVIIDCEAHICSLKSKVSAFKEVEVLDSFWETVLISVECAIKALNYWALTLREAFIYQWISTVGNKVSQMYIIHRRSLVCLAQAISIATTAIMSKLIPDQNGCLGGEIRLWPYLGPSLVTLSHLSCIGQEQGMLQDQVVAWSTLSTRCSFRLVCPFSSVESCIPLVEGDATKLVISLPLHDTVFKMLPQRLQSGGLFRVHGIVWNMGVNHEAFLGSFTGTSIFEKETNQIALAMTHKYLQMIKSTVQDLDNSCANMMVQQASCVFVSLSERLRSGPVDKNMAVLWLAAECAQQMGGILNLCCKSGKDRTGMAATLLCWVLNILQPMYSQKIALLPLRSIISKWEFSYIRRMLETWDLKKWYQIFRLADIKYVNLFMDYEMHMHQIQPHEHFEEAQILRKHHGLPENEVEQVAQKLREYGVRRENCRKNIGKPVYSFSTLQVKFFLPALYKPPAGTYRESALT